MSFFSLFFFFPHLPVVSNECAQQKPFLSLCLTSPSRLAELPELLLFSLLASLLCGPSALFASPTMFPGASGRGGGAASRPFSIAAVVLLLLGSAVSWAGSPTEAGKAKSAEGTPAVFTLGDLLAGTYGELQRYAESAMGIGVVRSAVEVQHLLFHSSSLQTFCFSPSV